MKVKNVLVSLAFVLAISATSTTVQQRPDWSGFKDLTFEIATPKESYVRLEPIPLVLTLSNQTNRVLTGHGALEFFARHVKVWTRAEGEEWREIERLSTMQALLIVNPREMQPGDKFTANDTLNLLTEKIFPQPGSYELKATAYCGDGIQTVEAPPIKIRIKEPEGRDLEAYEFLHANTRHEYFFTGAYLVRNDKAQQVLETFVERFEETVYGDYACLVLAQLRFAYRDYDAARLQLERLAKKPAFGLAAKAKEYLVLIQHRQR